MLKLVALLLLVNGLNVQGLARHGSYYPPLARRLQGNCSTSCEVCVKGLLFEWAYYKPESTATITRTEVFEGTDAASAASTITGDPEEQYSIAYGSYQEYIASSGTRIKVTSGGDGEPTTFTYPTPFVSIENDWYWQGKYPDGDEVCVTADSWSKEAAAVPLRALPAPGALNREDGTPDLKGAYFQLASKDIDAVEYITADPAIVCNSNCANAPMVEPMQIVAAFPPTVTGALTVAFVTKCEKSVSGAATVEACGDNTGGGTSPEEPETGGGTNPEQPETGGGTNPEQPETGGGTGTNPKQPESGGNDNPDSAPRITTTDSGGNPVIIAGTPTAGGSNNGGGGGGGGIYATTNAQGQVVYATYGPGETPPPAALANGQITLTDSSGATVVVQGGELSEVAGSGGGDQPGAITVTDARGSLVVIQGGTTGTLSVGQNGDTAVIVGTLTATSWVPGESVPGSEAGQASQSTGLAGEGTMRSPKDGSLLLTSLLVGSLVLIGVVL